MSCQLHMLRVKKSKNHSAARLEKYHEFFSTVVLLVFVIKNDNNEGDQKKQMAEGDKNHCCSVQRSDMNCKQLSAC